LSLHHHQAQRCLGGIIRGWAPATWATSRLARAKGFIWAEQGVCFSITVVMDRGMSVCGDVMMLTQTQFPSTAGFNVRCSPFVTEKRGKKWF
jgi:hypothetical protein